MSNAGAADLTRLLHEWKAGNREALDRLIPIVYPELRVIASRQLAREWRHDRLQTTAVVNEAYMKLFGQRKVDSPDRDHFFMVAAKLMRRILIDHARRLQRDKRGGGNIPIALDESLVPGVTPVAVVDALDLERALQKLERLDPDQEKIVELRFFGGLTIDETASALGISVATVKREWATAKGWLYCELMGVHRPTESL